MYQYRSMARRFVRSLAPRLRLFRAAAGVGVVVAWLSGCAPSSGGVNVATGGTAGQTGATGGGGSGGSGATPVLAGGSAPIISGGSGNTPSSGGSGAVTACATENTEAEPAPLDIYVMLDSSLSMVDLTPSGVSKWDAVRSAISAFLQDPSSAGISVGIQYFPLRKPGVPARCTGNAECGPGGSCLLKWCSKYGNFVAGGIAQCDDDADCTEIPALTNYGPCMNGSCAMDSVRTCSGDSECLVEAMANFGPCATFGHCEGATDVACPAIGMDCGPDEQGVQRGVCVAAADSYCFHGTQCDTAGYAAPAVEIGLLPEASATLVASLEAQVPDGDTPSGPALRGAIAHAREWAVAHPGHTVVAVLATDGLPTECLPDDVRFTRTTSQARLVDDVIAVAAEGAQGAPSISTFVIGVFADSDQEAPENLRRIAEAGGTTQAQLVDTSQDVSAQFIAALNAVRASRVQCELQIPKPHGGATPNYFEVNVAFTENGTTTTLYYVGSPDRCDPVEGGWYYDDFAGVAPNRILVCPQNCNVFQASTTGSVEIQLGCETILR
jgi:hypothetical protein